MIYATQVTFLVLDTMKTVLAGAVDELLRSGSLDKDDKEVVLDKEGTIISFCLEHIRYVYSSPVQSRASECLGTHKHAHTHTIYIYMYMCTIH